MSKKDSSDPADEFEALRAVYTVLEPLSPEGRDRVVSYVTSRLGIAEPRSASLTELESGDEGTDQPSGQEDTPDGQDSLSTFADLHNATAPSTNAEHALIAAYWVQEHKGKENFGSQIVNTELKNLGLGLTNITEAFDQLRNSRPALILQVRKSGTTRQARKTFKLTEAGISRVQEMTSE